MVSFIVYDKDSGRILRTGTCPAEFVANQALPGRNEVAMESDALPYTHYVVNGALVRNSPEVEHRLRNRPAQGYMKWDEHAAGWRDNRSKSVVDHAMRDRLLAQIAGLERKQARSIRELTIGRGGSPAALRARLEAIDDQIAELRSQLPPV